MLKEKDEVNSSFGRFFRRLVFKRQFKRRIWDGSKTNLGQILADFVKITFRRTIFEKDEFSNADLMEWVNSNILKTILLF